MKDRKEREAEAQAYFEQALQRVANTPEPEGQKFPNGSRVLIANDLGETMAHFGGKGKKATVQFVYAHAFGGDNVKSYSLNVDGLGSCAWYYEHQLTAIDS
jgi:hypothetical protein